MAAPVLLFAVGNESRGDDALGPQLLRQLDEWLNSGEGRCSQGAGRAVPVASATTATLREKGEGFVEQFELIEDFQLQIEHAMDMKDRQRVLFIDAGMQTPAPFAFYRAEINEDAVLYSHALSPEALLKVYTQFYKEAPPDSYVLCVSGESFELGASPSSQAVENLAFALAFAKEALSGVSSWDERCTQSAPIRSVHGTTLTGG